MIAEPAHRLEDLRAAAVVADVVADDEGIAHDRSYRPEWCSASASRQQRALCAEASPVCPSCRTNGTGAGKVHELPDRNAPRDQHVIHTEMGESVRYPQIWMDEQSADGAECRRVSPDRPGERKP